MKPNGLRLRITLWVTAGGVIVIRRLVSHQMAQVDEVFLINLFLACGHAFPFTDEILRGKRHVV
jgi:hypothetical protein